MKNIIFNELFNHHDKAATFFSIVFEPLDSETSYQEKQELFFCFLTRMEFLKKFQKGFPVRSFDFRKI